MNAGGVAGEMPLREQTAFFHILGVADEERTGAMDPFRTVKPARMGRFQRESMPRVVDVVQAVALLLGIAAGVLVATRRRIIRRLTDASALDESSAVPLPSSGPVSGFWVRRLLDAGVVRRLPDGRAWLDAPAWSEYRRVRRRRALALVATLLAAAAVAWLATRPGGSAT